MTIHRLVKNIGRMLMLLTFAASANAAITDLAKLPLIGATSELVLPNLMFIIDDSGSMGYDYLPDWSNDGFCKATDGKFDSKCCRDASGAGKVPACYEGAQPFGTWRGSPPYLNAAFNRIYYDPAISYIPPTNANGSSKPNQTTYTSVKNDYYGVQSVDSTNLLTEFPDLAWCTDSGYSDCLRNGNYIVPGTVGGKSYRTYFATQATGSGLVVSGTTAAPITAKRELGPHYYTMIPSQYCDSVSLRNCSNVETATFKYPAPIRWCKDSSALSNCQASKTATYKYARYSNLVSSGGTKIGGSWIRTDIVPSIVSYPYPGTAAKHKDRTDCAGTTCTYDEEMTNFANWWTYYRTRMQMMKSAASTAFNSVGDNLRVGYMSINGNVAGGFLNLSKFDTTQKNLWYNRLTSTIPGNKTPLRQALTDAGRIYGGKLKTINGVTVVDPVQYSCQRNITILSTDGYWNETTTGYQMDGTTPIGNQDGTLPRPLLDGNNTSNTLADVAAYYYNTDLRDKDLFNNCDGPVNAGKATDLCENNVSTIPDDTATYQHMLTNTLGLGIPGYMQFDPLYKTAMSGDYYDVTKGTTADATHCSWQISGACNWPKPLNDSQENIDDLWHAATNGHGTYASADKPNTLTKAIEDMAKQPAGIPSSGSAAVTSNPNASTTDNLVFATEFTPENWSGDLLSLRTNTTTGAVTSNKDAIWNAKNQIISNVGRNIITYDKASKNQLPFKWASLTPAMQAYFLTPHISSLSQLCSIGPKCLDTAGKAGAVGANLVDFLGGNRKHEVASQASPILPGDLSGTGENYYRNRGFLLGDIVNSEAVYVRAPLYEYTDPGYLSYKAGQAARQGVVYVAANDGMLHAFNADTGAELWAYIPSEALTKIYKLADKSYRHEFFVDGTPVVADALIKGSWRTILVGGLAGGGRSYYAIDITVPSAPIVLWEFSNENLGFAYGKPEITKLANGTWTVMVTSGYNNVSPGDGIGRLFVLDASTGDIIEEMSTERGTTASPSGLAQIRAWVDDGFHNNTATHVYGGDLDGNLWRFDVNHTIVKANSAYLLATLKGKSGQAQSMVAKPELGEVSNQHMIYVGTGKYLGASDVNDSSDQTIYAIKDTLTNTSFIDNPRSKTSFVEQKLTGCVGCTTVTGTELPVNLVTDNDGWFANLPGGGERANTDPALALGTLAFVTNQIEPNACKATNSSYIYYFNYRTGGTLDRKTHIAGRKIGDFISTRPILTKLPDGTITAVIQGERSRDTAPAPFDLASTGTNRVSWHELIMEQ